MADPDHDRNINRLSWIAFVLAFIACLLGIIFSRPTPVSGAVIDSLARSL